MMQIRSMRSKQVAEYHNKVTKFQWLNKSYLNSFKCVWRRIKSEDQTNRSKSSWFRVINTTCIHISCCQWRLHFAFECCLYKWIAQQDKDHSWNKFALIFTHYPSFSSSIEFSEQNYRIEFKNLFDVSLRNQSWVHLSS